MLSWQAKPERNERSYDAARKEYLGNISKTQDIKSNAYEDEANVTSPLL
jgi:hypothetical protein